MSKTDHIAQINAGLATLDPAGVEIVADLVASMTAPPAPVRALTTRERELLEASRRDFAEGRTLSLEEWRANTDAVFARYRAAE